MDKNSDYHALIDMGINEPGENFYLVPSHTRLILNRDVYPMEEEGEDFVWAVTSNKDNDLSVINYGICDYPTLRIQLDKVSRNERKRRELMIGALLDDTAHQVLIVLDDKTSLKWNELEENIDLQWHDICRGVSILSGAGFCESSSKRIRISDDGDIFLQNLDDSHINMESNFLDENTSATEG